MLEKTCRSLATCMRIALLLCPVLAFAQFDGNVQGTVTDQSGAVVPQAAVTLHNTQTGVDNAAQTDNAGFYRVAGVVPGPYQVIVDAKGFQKTRVAFTVGAQETAGVNVALQVSTSSIQVTVSEQAPGINPDETRLLTTISGSQLPELPLPNRGTLNIIKLRPV